MGRKLLEQRINHQFLSDFEKVVQNHLRN